MLIRAKGVIGRGAHQIEPGTEVHIPDAEAFQLIESGFAEPASRLANKVYLSLKAKAEALKPPPGPDLRDRYVSAPQIDYTHPIRDGRITRINSFN